MSFPTVLPLVPGSHWLSSPGPNAWEQALAVVLMALPTPPTKKGAALH